MGSPCPLLAPLAPLRPRTAAPSPPPSPLPPPPPTPTPEPRPSLRGRCGERGGTTDGADVADLEELGAEVGELQFAPEKGNVLFASAMHGWGFSLHDFAKLYATKLGMRQEVLQRSPHPLQ